MSSAVSQLVKDSVLSKIYPTKETLEAIRRLREGKGLKISFKDLIDMHIRVYPEYENILLGFYQTFMDNQKIILGSSSNFIHFQRNLVVDPFYEKKVRLAKRFYCLSPVEIESYESNLGILLLGGYLKSRFRDHSLTKKGTQDLRGFRFFLVHLDTSNVPDTQKKSIICLYCPTPKILYLANFGIHDKVYKQGSISHEEKAYI